MKKTKKAAKKTNKSKTLRKAKKLEATKPLLVLSGIKGESTDSGHKDW